MIIDLNDEEKSLISFHLCCRLEDYEKEIKKHSKNAEYRAKATDNLHKLEEIIYTKFIPESWCGPRPSY